MFRLNDRAKEILRAEVQKCSTADITGQVQREIILKRLEKLYSSKGEPASLEELRDTVKDIFPNFSEKALKAAARANRPPGALSKITQTAGILVAASGVLWVMNLPYPMIRWPVARTAPILLLPSYISMDYHHRHAIARVEQADQLINKATSSADFTLGEVKVKEAQQHLDALPVWFLGYWPQYTFWFGWQFTLDEYKTARANVGRMEAKIFQEKNALQQLNQGVGALNAAAGQYQQKRTAASDKQTALASWQAAIDQLSQVPPETLAGRTAQTKLVAAKRDFEQVSGLAAHDAQTNIVIAAAQQFAIAASVTARNPPHSTDEWEESANLWQQAIERLTQVSVTDPGYIEAQKLLAKYQRNLGIVRIQKSAEQASVEALKQAKDTIPIMFASAAADNSAENRNRLIGQLQGIINQLETVKSGTTAYPEAQKLMESAQKNLKQVQPK